VLLIIILIILSSLFTKKREGLENKDCDISSTVYKNAGAISNLEKNINDMMSKLNNIISETSEFTEMKKKLEVTSKTADDNKTNIRKYAEQAKGESTDASNRQANLQPI